MATGAALVGLVELRRRDLIDVGRHGRPRVEHGLMKQFSQGTAEPVVDWQVEPLLGPPHDLGRQPAVADLLEEPLRFAVADFER